MAADTVTPRRGSRRRNRDSLSATEVPQGPPSHIRRVLGENVAALRDRAFPGLETAADRNRALAEKLRSTPDQGTCCLNEPRSVRPRIRAVVVRPPEPREVATEVQFEVTSSTVTDIADLGTACLRTGQGQ